MMVVSIKTDCPAEVGKWTQIIMFYLKYSLNVWITGCALQGGKSSILYHV